MIFPCIQNHKTGHGRLDASRHYLSGSVSGRDQRGLLRRDHVFTDAQKSFWSLQPVKKPAVPAVKAKQWVNNPIDAFVLAKLEEKQLQPNKAADKITLLRRVTIDLTGLVPTPDEIQAFVNDNSPNGL